MQALTAGRQRLRARYLGQGEGDTAGGDSELQGLPGPQQCLSKGYYKRAKEWEHQPSPATLQTSTW